MKAFLEPTDQRLRPTASGHEIREEVVGKDP